MIFFQFQAEQESENKEKFKYLTANQMKWIQMNELIGNARPNFDLTRAPDNKFRLKVFNVVTSNMFDGIIMVCIILNILSMGMIYDGMTEEFGKILEYVNLFFTAVFIIEAILKIGAQGTQYFLSNWNIFDFSIVCSSVINVGLDIMGKNFVMWLRSGPQLARV